MRECAIRPMTEAIEGEPMRECTNCSIVCVHDCRLMFPWEVLVLAQPRNGHVSVGMVGCGERQQVITSPLQNECVYHSIERG